MMLAFELSVLGMIIVYALTQTGRGPEKRERLLFLLLVSLAAWSAEESSIRLYEFYLYSPDWHFKLGHMPVMVVAVWPMVVHSAWNLARQLTGTDRKVIPLAACGIVLADATLIEVAAVHSGLWTWFRPGLFNVPPIGILGWSFFAWFCLVLMQWQAFGSKKQALFLLPVLPVLGTHLLLLLCWWGIFRWINHPIDPRPVVCAAWGLSAGLVWLVARKRASLRVEPRTLFWRLPAALFFYILLAVNARSEGWLVLFSLAFAPPYLALLFVALDLRAPGRRPPALTLQR